MVNSSLNSEHIHGLREEVIRELSPLVQGRCALLDLPNYPNVGDHLIWEGTECFLERNTGSQLDYASASVFFDRSRVERVDRILLQGGGNFGDLYPKHMRFREAVVTRFMDHPIVLLPQTAFYRDPDNLQRTITAFSRHPRLTLCARDHVTLKFMQTHFPENTIRLVPDMAFCLDRFSETHQHRTPQEILFMLREDGEQPLDTLVSACPDADVFDWPTMQSSRWHDISATLRQGAERCVHAGLALAHALPGEHAWDYRYHYMRQHQPWIEEGINMVKRYDLVVTNRLHGHVLAILLGVPSILLDNSYGKNCWFHDAWLKDCPGSRFAGSAAELQLQIQQWLSA